ncbi:MAG: hypothetical protein U9N06_06330 [candidate division WOR-3 bacterium]|nr:hypothetical protein [candidate division WOR-3 bacterium]
MIKINKRFKKLREEYLPSKVLGYYEEYTPEVTGKFTLNQKEE